MIEIDYHKMYNAVDETIEPNYIKAIMPMDLPDGYSGVEIWFHRLPLLDGFAIENAKITCTATTPIESDGSKFRAFGYIEAPSLQNGKFTDMSGEDARLFLVNALLAICSYSINILNYIDTTKHYYPD